ncbi:serine/threonine protein kinase [Streptomyces sp. A7024]|uniref:Serine/threonine protein kinase n=1 Tax=Streptomyces coryli TaxID=1128680 RepID=A0A6G4UBX0_9ACTN|nr:serine/threonine-protein kinase [Streptomyces coryli]NGN68691.1 serine/threonine protein kinase [Streptomyces coryli]
MVSRDSGDGSIQPLKTGDPERIGPYRLLGRLGAGGMGRVFLARSEGGRTVAVKVVHEDHIADDRFRGRFRREIAAARKVGERYTAPVLDSGPDAEPPWVATGYVPGLTLEQVVRTHGPLPGPSLHALADHLLHALREIHATGIVHRDLKPSNVMLTASGTKVIDFGIARALDTSSVESLLTSTGVVLGSPGFMSPEQIRGQGAGPESDVFTLGHILTYAATGTLPFGQGAENQHAVMFRIVQDEPDLEAVEDLSLRTLIARCLTKDPAERPGVDELLDDPDRTKPVASSGSWLPAEVMARLAQQSARLLEADSQPVRVSAEAGEPAETGEPSPEEAPAPAGGSGQTPVVGQPQEAERERRPRRRNRLIAVPVVLVLAAGGGTVALLQPFGGETRGGTHAQDRDSATGGPSAGEPSADGGSPSKDAGDGEDGKDGKKGKDASAAPGADGQEDKAGAEEPDDGTAGAGAGSSDGGTDGAGSGDTSTGGSGSSGGSGSGSGGGGGDAGSSSAVPSYFVGKWQIPGGGYSPSPQKATISRGSVGDQVVRLYYNMGFGTCTYAARLSSVTDAGSRINLSSAPVVADNTGGQCQTFQASSFYISQGGLNHDADVASGDMHMVRQ